MDWNQIITNVVISLVGIIISIVGAFITKKINKDIKDDKIKNILSNAFGVINDGVNYVYQTYVQSLKGTDLWDEEAMNTANQKAIEYIKNNLSKDLFNYLSKNKKDLDEWIREQIEIAIAKDKKTSK